MYTKYLIVFIALASVPQNYGMGSVLTRATNKTRTTVQSIRSKASDYKPKAVAAVAKTIKDQKEDIIQSQVREFHERSPRYRMGRAVGKSMVFNALTQSALSYYNILTFAALPLPISILLGGALLSAPALIFDASEILKKRWNYFRQKRTSNDVTILHTLLDRITLQPSPENESTFIKETDVPPALVNKPLLPGNKTILQAALEKNADFFNVQTLINAGADPNPSVPDEAHPISILLHHTHPDLETLALLINPLIIPVDTLKPLPQMVEQRVKDFVQTKKLTLKDKTDEWSQIQRDQLNSIGKALETRKTLLWEKEVTLKKQSQPLSPIDL